MLSPRQRPAQLSLLPSWPSAGCVTLIMSIFTGVHSLPSTLLPVGATMQSLWLSCEVIGLHSIDEDMDTQPGALSGPWALSTAQISDSKARDFNHCAWIPWQLTQPPCLSPFRLLEQICHRLSSLNSISFSQFWRLASLKSKVLADSVSGEGQFPSLQMAAFSLCPHMAEREIKRDLGAPLMRALIPCLRAPPSSDHLSKAPPLVRHIEVRLSIYEI